jgi:hypothetical protein
MFMIAAAVQTGSYGLAWLCLVIFLAGSLVLLGGIALVGREVQLSHSAIQFEVERLLQLGPQTDQPKAR